MGGALPHWLQFSSRPVKEGTGAAGNSFLPAPWIGILSLRSKLGRSGEGCCTASSTWFPATKSRAYSLFLLPTHSTDESGRGEPLLFTTVFPNQVLPSLGNGMGALPCCSICSAPRAQEQSRGEGTPPIPQTPVWRRCKRTIPWNFTPDRTRRVEQSLLPNFPQTRITAPCTFPRPGSPNSCEDAESRGEGEAAG